MPTNGLFSRFWIDKFSNFGLVPVKFCQGNKKKQCTLFFPKLGKKTKWSENELVSRPQIFAGEKKYDSFDVSIHKNNFCEIQTYIYTYIKK